MRLYFIFLHSFIHFARVPTSRIILIICGQPECGDMKGERYKYEYHTNTLGGGGFELQVDLLPVYRRPKACPCFHLTCREIEKRNPSGGFSSYFRIFLLIFFALFEE